MRPSFQAGEVSLSRFFNRRTLYAPAATYAYDFGDEWQHVVVHEGMGPAEESLSYPRCIGGARRCPPEDCGVHGYVKFLAIVTNPRHPEYRSMLRWAEASTTLTSSTRARSSSTIRVSGGRMRSTDRSVAFGLLHCHEEQAAGGEASRGHAQSASSGPSLAVQQTCFRLQSRPGAAVIA